jgi:ABC-type multidrug transport system fused ATPase/permease subunit
MFNFVASAVDSQKRKGLWQMLFTNLMDTTKVVATQQMEALRKMEEIVYIKDGKVAEREIDEEMLGERLRVV